MNTFLHTSPEKLGISSTALLKLMQRLGKLEYINSFILMRHGQLCLETYVAPYEREVPHQLFSLSKSFVSCAIGIAQSEKLLSVDDKLADFFPEFAHCITDERMRAVTLKDLLTMRSGHLSCPTSNAEFWQSADWRQTYLASKLDTEPGTEFTYNSIATYMLSAVITKVTGQNVREYLMKRLFEPLAIAPGIWECCPQGINCGGWGLYLKTADIAKFAQCLLQQGVWQGKQLIPQDYLAEATSFQSDNSKNAAPDWKLGYGYQFWRSRHGFRGDGAAGQYAVVLPEEDIAIAVTSCVGNMQDILTAIWEELLPAIANEPLKEDAEAANELKMYCSNMQIPVVQGDITYRNKNAFFEFADNPEQIKSCEVCFGNDDCTLTFNGPHGIEQLRAGFGKFAFSLLQLSDRKTHPVFASAAWKENDILEIRSYIADGIYKDIWQIDFNDPDEPVKNQNLCSCFRPQKPRLLLKKQSK